MPVAGTTARAGATAPPLMPAVVTTAPQGVATAGTTAPAAGSTAPAAAGSTAAAAGTAAPAPGAATFTAVLAIFAKSQNACGLCHKTAASGGGLMFDPADKAGSFAALVGPKSAGLNGSTCTGKTYVVPGMPDASLLYEKIAKAMPSCGARMPATGTIMMDDEIATVRAWIMAGAKND